MSPPIVGAVDVALADVEDEGDAAAVVVGAVGEGKVARAHQLARARLDVAALQIPRPSSTTSGVAGVDSRPAAPRGQPAVWETRPIAWSINGTYFESCNCDAICPCRRIDGDAGRPLDPRRLPWRPVVADRDGAADGVDLTGLPVAMAIRYSDDEPGSPWTWVLYLDDARRRPQRRALEDDLHRPARRRRRAATSRGRGRRASWSRCAPSRSTSTTRGAASGCASATTSASASATATPGATSVTCVIPGHDRTGEELVADELSVEDGPLAFSYRGVCGYGTRRSTYAG